MSIESVEALATAQFGVFSRAQALENITEKTLRHHSGPGRRWLRVAPGVYGVKAAPGDRRFALMAAQLWGGPEAVLSHRSAAALLGLDLDRRDQGITEFRLVRSTRPPDGWMRYRLATDADRTTKIGPLRCTDPLTTVVDLGTVLDDDRLEWALESALRRRLLNVTDLEAATGPGSDSVRRVLGRRPPGARPTGSIRETQFVQMARGAEVDAFERQYPVVRDGEVVAQLDLAWPHLGVFIEIDGRWHDEAQAKPYDRHRQNEVVTLLGWRPLRYGSDDIVGRPHYTAKRLQRSFLQARQWAAQPVGRQAPA